MWKTKWEGSSWAWNYRSWIVYEEHTAPETKMEIGTNLFIRKLQVKASEQCTLVMYIKLDPQQPFGASSAPLQHYPDSLMGLQTLRALAAHGELQDGVSDTEGGLLSTGIFTRALGSDCTKSNLKDCPDPLLDSRHYRLFAFPCNREETEKEGNKKTMPEPANEFGKAAGLQPPVP